MQRRRAGRATPTEHPAPAGERTARRGRRSKAAPAGVTNGSAVVTFVAAGTFVLCYSFGERRARRCPRARRHRRATPRLAAVEDPSLASPDLLGAVVGVNTSFDAARFWRRPRGFVRVLGGNTSQRPGGALNVTAAAAAARSVSRRRSVAASRSSTRLSRSCLRRRRRRQGAPTLALCYRRAARPPYLVSTVRLRVHALDLVDARDRRDRRPHVHGLLRRRRRRRRRRGGVGAARGGLQCRDVAGDRGRFGGRVGGVAGRRRVAAATVLSLRSCRRLRPIQFGRRLCRITAASASARPRDELTISFTGADGCGRRQAAYSTLTTHVPSGSSRRPRRTAEAAAVGEQTVTDGVATFSLPRSGGLRLCFGYAARRASSTKRSRSTESVLGPPQLAL